MCPFPPSYVYVWSPPTPRAINQDSTIIENGAARNTLSQKEASLMANDPTNVGEVLGGGSSTVPNPYGESQTIIYNY